MSLIDKRNGVIADGTFNYEDVKEAVKELMKGIEITFECHTRYGKSTIGTRMRFSDILRNIKDKAGKELCEGGK